MYKHEYLKMDGIRVPKMAIPEEIRSQLGKDSIEVTEILGLPIVVTVEMRVNAKGSYQIKEWSANKAIQLSSNKTKYFADGRYRTDDDTESYGAWPAKIEKGTGKKNILGYPCEQFTITNLDTKEVLIVWATDKLPEGITGFYRMPAFGYAVLEMASEKGTWRRTATRIIPVKDNENLFTIDAGDSIKD